MKTILSILVLLGTSSAFASGFSLSLCRNVHPTDLTLQMQCEQETDKVATSNLEIVQLACDSKGDESPKHINLVAACYRNAVFMLKGIPGLELDTNDCNTAYVGGVFKSAATCYRTFIQSKIELEKKLLTESPKELTSKNRR